MSESVSIAEGLKIAHTGIFDMEELYKLVKWWLELKGYGSEDKTFREEKYTERIKGDAKNIDIRWKAEKIINDYVSYVMTITFQTIAMGEVEIEQEGRKVKVNSGKITVKMDSKVVLDRQDKWKSDFFRNLYQNFIIKDRIDAHCGDLYNHTYTIHDEIKAFFEMNQ